MDLIERYLASVRILLPKRQREDIAAELRDVLTGRREEHAFELGRPLTQEEEERLLRDFGHPVVIAGRYGRQQYLIGQDLYPVYVFVLKLVLVIIGASALLVGVVSAVASSGAAGPAALKAIAIAWNGAFSAVGAVTIIFAMLQRYSPRLRLLSDWRARDLPLLRKARRVTWFDHVAGIVANVVFILWWTRVIQLSPLIPLKADQSLHLSLAPIWQGLYWPVLGLAVGAIAIHSFRLMREESRRLASVLDLALQLGLLVVTSVALHAGHWVVVTGNGLPAHALSDIDRGVNIGLEVTLIVIVCVAVIRGGYDLWRLSGAAGR
jgi:hypothetical protein